MKNIINISLIRIVKNKNEINQKENLEVIYKSGIYVLINNFAKYEELKKKNRYIRVRILTPIKEVSEHITFRITKERINPIESALLFNELEQINDITQNELAKKLYITQGNISNKKRLLKLPLNVQVDIIKNVITERHGRALLQLVGKHDDKISKVYDEIVMKKLNVSETENLINKILGKKTPIKEEDIKELKNKRDLKNQLALPAINQLENEITKSLELIEKYYPQLDIKFIKGTKNKDYILAVEIKNVK